jgi:hypothetical protein
MKTKAIFLTILFLSSQSFGWGNLGHRTVGEIAITQLTPQTQAQVKKLLGRESVADVASWADTLRSDGSYPQTNWYHFEKMDDGATFIPHIKQLPEWQLKKGGMVMAILVAVENLKSSSVSKREKSDTLKFLIHYVGDVHQPLHTGPAEDNGGVKHNLEWFGEPMSLHKVWDSAMMYGGHKDVLIGANSVSDESKMYAKYLIKQFAQKPVAADFDVERWLMESMSFRKAAYDPTCETDQDLYQSKNLPVVDRRLYEAGMRLGALLNAIYDGSPMNQAHDFWNRILTVTNPQDIISFKP